MIRIKVGGLVLVVLAILGIIFVTLALPVDLYLYEMGPYFADGPGFVVYFIPWDIFDWRWALTIPIYLLLVVGCVGLLYIGGKMVTTPAPKPTRVEEREEEPIA